jgi:hypothetical protein
LSNTIYYHPARLLYVVLKKSRHYHELDGEHTRCGVAVSTLLKRYRGGRSAPVTAARPAQRRLCPYCAARNGAGVNGTLRLLAEMTDGSEGQPIDTSSERAGTAPRVLE